MFKKIVFDYNQAFVLWTDGWCWNALGKKYDCCGGTVKKGVGENCNLTETERVLHSRRHNKNCPFCTKNYFKKVLKPQVETLFLKKEVSSN